MAKLKHDPGVVLGVKKRTRTDGTTAYYWVATGVSKDPRVMNYPHKTVRLFGDEVERRSIADRMTAELRRWLGQADPTSALDAFDGTVTGLIDAYKGTPESPYHSLKHNTRTMYDESLALLSTNVGKRKLAKLTGLDFKRWYAEFKAPAPYTPKEVEAARLERVPLPQKPERVRRAYKAMQLLRIIVKFGIVADIPECVRLGVVLENMEFSAPPARIGFITFEQTQAICTAAIKSGRLSIAIAQALQFELTLRQSDVIGMWEPAKGERSGIVDRGRRWSGGVLWSHLGADGVLRKQTTKTGATAEHDTTAYPFLESILARVPAEKRIGPMIIDEGSGIPYRYRHFVKLWRKIADDVGVPSTVWNRDSRAGGVTEGSDAGADIEHLRHHATHSDAATTGRYNRRTVEKTRKVAELRVAHRGGKQ